MARARTLRARRKPRGPEGATGKVRRNPFRTAIGALFGLHKRADFERDAEHLTPFQLVIVALMLIVMFVGGVSTLVYFVLH